MYRRQTAFFGKISEHGGEHSVGRRKVRRPVVTKRAMHLTMRSTKAVGNWSLLHPRHRGFVSSLVATLSKKYDVKIYQFSNNGNHLHLLVKAKTRKGFQSFLRLLSGRLALRITGAKKGKSLASRFWDLPAFTRIVEWGKDFKTVTAYVIQNINEALGLVPYKPRMRAKPK